MTRNPAKIVVMVIGGMAAAAALLFLVGLIVRTLWNALMPEIFGLPEIGYWQGVGLLLLGHLLFGAGFRHERNIRHRRSLPSEPPRDVEIRSTVGL